MATETERKFLLNPHKLDLLEEGFKTHTNIEQGYLVIDGKEHVRVRIYDNQKAELTYKNVKSLFSREEINVDIPLDKAIELMNITEKKFKKFRYSKFDEINKLQIDIDFYVDIDLAVVEIEYTSEELDEKLIPDYCCEDITDKKEFSNIQIAIDAYIKFEESLA